MDIGFLIIIFLVFLLAIVVSKLKLIKKSNPIIFWCISLLLGFSLLFGINEFFRRVLGGFAGSYPFVEYWDLNATEKEVVDAIKELKTEYPELQPPNQKQLTSTRLVDYDWSTEEMINYSRAVEKDSLLPLPPKTKANTKSGYWLFIDFYYPDTKEIVHTWTRPNLDTTYTTFAFVSLSRIGDSKDDRLINRDFWYIANKRQINKFKSIFVDRIQERIDQKRKAAHNTGFK